MARLAFEGLTFSYPGAEALALDDVTLNVPSGSLVLVCGRSGCGKTTLIRQAKTVLAPHGARSGRVRLDGVPIDEISVCEQAARIGFLMQDADAQIVSDKVWHELAFGLENLGVDEREIRLRIAETASYFGIGEWMDADASSLSGGQRQLVCLASVLVGRPDILILDEPTSNLDPIAASEFLAIVQRLHVDLGITIMMVEQRLDEAYAMADKVVVMSDGRLLCEGDPKEVGWHLLSEDSEMAQALPSSMRIFHRVEGRSVDEAISLGASGMPMTVRDAKAWLEDLPLAKDVKIASPSTLTPAHAQGPFAIELADAWMRYGRDLHDVLRGVDLSVARGSLHALIGGNGCGKTTLLKVARGMLRPYRGCVRIQGEAIGRRGRSASKHSLSGVAMLPQDPLDLFVKDNVADDLREMVDDRGEGGHDARDETGHIVCAFGIEGIVGSHPADLSRGELQRAALAKVMLARPEVLLLDEPTKGLDAIAKRSLEDMLFGLRDQGITILLVSHDLEFCARVADMVSMMFDGRIAASAPPRDLFSRNSFYTTSASRISRGVFEAAVTDDDVVRLCAKGLS